MATRLPSERLFHRLLDKLPAGAYMCDADGLITYFNPHAEQVWGRAPALRDPVDRYCGSFALFSARDGSPLAHDECWMALAIREQRDFNGEEIIVERPDGTRLTVLAHASPIHEDDGRLLGAVNVLVDITDRKKMEEALKGADRAKNEFLATVSHEIRTPINAIVGYLDLLEMELGGPLTDTQRKQVGRIRAASRHLHSLVTDVLDLAKIEAGKMSLSIDPRPVGDAVDAALAVVQPMAGVKGIGIRARIEDERHLHYLGDDARVRQMLINLLSNAVKFSETGSDVELTCSLDHRPAGSVAAGGNSGSVTTDRTWIRFDLRDRGIGIAPEQLDRIFQPFVQVEPGRTSNRGGAGLGLAISRQLARLMGGDLTVESAFGRGSVFRLWLPLADGPDVNLTSRLVGGSDPGEGTAPDAGCAFATAGRALLVNLEELVAGYADVVHELRLGNGDGHLSPAQVTRHIGPFVADLAAEMLAIDDPDSAADAFTEASDVRRICATEQARLRAGLGWSATDIAQGFDVLEHQVVRCICAAGSAGLDMALAVAAARRAFETARSYTILATGDLVVTAETPRQ